MSAHPAYFDQINGERSVAPFIPYRAHVDDHTISTEDGDYMRIWKVAGLAFETQDPEETLRRKEQLNTLWRSIASDEVAVWTHLVRRATTDELNGRFPDAFSRRLNTKYGRSFSGYKMMANEWYLTVIYRPKRPGATLLKGLGGGGRRNLADLLAAQEEAIAKLDEIAFNVEAGMQRYGLDGRTGIEPLGVYEIENLPPVPGDMRGPRKSGKCSQALEFLNFLITGVWQRVRLPDGPLNEYLGNAWVHVGGETIEIRTPDRTRFARCLDFKDYAPWVEPGILNTLMYADIEFVLTQSYSFMSKREARKFLDRQATRLANGGDGTPQEVAQLDKAIEQLMNGQFAMGEYHFGLMVFGDSARAVKVNTTTAMSQLQDEGFLASLVTTATDAAFYAQLPCNWRFRPRVAGISSQAFACLSGFHNFRAGKRNGNPWGEALALLKSPSGQPAYLNYHYGKGDEDNFAKMMLGNTRIIGQSGAGKTVLMNFLMMQARKYELDSPTGMCQVVLDKDRGAMAAVLAVGGKYLAFRNGVPTGCQPFQMEPTPANIGFLEKLVKVLAHRDGKPLTTADEVKISRAVKTVMRMEKPLRRISTVLQNLPEGNTREDRDDSLAKRLAKWCADDGQGRVGSLAWVLDCESDEIDFSTHTVYGFDGTDFLDNEEMKTPMSMYLLHRMDGAIDGRRFVYYMDEMWKWVEDGSDSEINPFAEFAGNKQLTIRKLNGLGVFATQMPSSLLQSKIASQLVQQVATEIYLPNPKADYREYTEGFKVTAQEFRIIKNLDELSRMFLVKQGDKSMLCKLDLGKFKPQGAREDEWEDFDDELAILSGDSSNNELIELAIATVGPDPEVWEPWFQQQRKARIQQSKARKEGTP